MFGRRNIVDFFNRGLEKIKSKKDQLATEIDLSAWVCSKCHSELKLKKTSAVCNECKTKFPIKDNIIEFIDSPVDDGFDQRWNNQPHPQATTESVFWSKTGWNPKFLEGKLVLDAGCGNGRFSQIAEKNGSKVYALDGSVHGPLATKKNTLSAQIVRGDLLNPPFKEEFFDAAFSIGVLHHTADPKKAFMQLAKSVKRGGHLAIWVYCQPTPNDLLPVHDMFHEITKAVPPKKLLEIFEKYSLQIRELYKSKSTKHDWNILQSIVRVSHSENDDECIHDTFDWHTPQYRFWHTKEEVEGWFEEAGYRISYLGNFPVSIGGVRK